MSDRVRGARPGRPMLWAAAAVSVLWAVVDSPGAGRLWIGGLATAGAILAVSRLVWSRRQVHGRWVLEPPVLVAIAVATWHFAFWPMYYLGLASAGRKALYLGFVPTATSGAFLASLVGVLAIVGGVQAGLGREPTAPARDGRPLLDRRPGRLVWAIAIAGCLLILAYAASSGLSEVGDYGQVYLQDSGLRRLYNLGIVLLLGALAPILLAEPSGRRRLVFLGLVVLPALIVTAALGSRWVTFTAVAVALAATTVRGGRVRVAWMVVGALLLIAGGTIVKNVRSGLVNNPGDVPGVLFDRQVNPVLDLPQELGQTFLTVGGTIGALARPPGHPAGQELRFGETLVMPLVAIIPSGERLLGVTAPRPGREWAQIYFPRRYASEGYTMGFSTIAELILNFGIPGVGLGMALLGFALGRGWRRAVDRRSAAGVYAVWAVCAFALFGVRNDLYTSLRWAIWAAIAVFVAGRLQDRGLSPTRPRELWRALPQTVGAPLRARAGAVGTAIGRGMRAATAGEDPRGHPENSFGAVRLLAALSIFWFHQIAILGHGSVLIPGTRATLTLGDIGLIAFFAVSGHLLTRSLQRDPSPRRYVRSRLLRFYPGLLVCLAVTFMVGMMVTRVGVADYLGDWSSYQYLLGNATIFASHTQLDLPGVFTTSIWPVVNAPLYALRYGVVFAAALLVLWTLPIGRRPRVAVVAAVALGAVAVGVLHAFAASPARFTTWDWSNAIKFGVPFALGAAVAATGLLVRFRLVLVAIAIAAAATLQWGSLAFQGNRTLAAVVLALGVLALGQSRLPRRLVPTPFGDLSYGIVLYGFLIQELVLTQAVGLGDVGIAVAAFVLTVCAAAASWRYVERPALARKAGTPLPTAARSQRGEAGAPRPRIIALVAFRDEMRFLPDFFANVAPHVDGIVALDDQSVDGSAEFVAAQPSVLEVLTVAPGAQDELEDGRNHRALTEAAWRHGADWLLGLDADERLEDGFRQRAEAEIRRADATGADAMWLHFRELWDSPDQYRADGIWATKRKACLYRSSPDHRFDERRVHAFWASMPPPPEDWPQADLNIYHLRMLQAADRAARRERYRRIDPDNVWQPIGYDYLLDETDLALEAVAQGRAFTPWPDRDEDGAGPAEGKASDRLQRST